MARSIQEQARSSDAHALHAGRLPARDGRDRTRQVRTPRSAAVASPTWPSLIAASPDDGGSKRSQNRAWRLHHHLYQVPEGGAPRGFPNRRGADSTWRTKEVRHVSSYTATWGFWGGTFARPGEEDKGRSAGPTATGAGGDLRRCDAHRGGEDRWRWAPAHPGLGIAV